MKFADIFLRLETGEKVRRTSWKATKYVRYDGTILYKGYTDAGEGALSSLSHDAVMATDWEAMQ